ALRGDRRGKEGRRVLPPLDLQGGVPEGDRRGAFALDAIVRDRVLPAPPALGDGDSRYGPAVFGPPVRRRRPLSRGGGGRGVRDHPADISLELSIRRSCVWTRALRNA